MHVPHSADSLSMIETFRARSATCSKCLASSNFLDLNTEAMTDAAHMQLFSAAP